MKKINRKRKVNKAYLKYEKGKSYKMKSKKSNKTRKR
jgi:hypothetical protein